MKKTVARTGNTPNRGVALEQPGQLSMRGHMRLHKDCRLVWVDAGGEIERGRLPRGVEQISGLVRHCDRVQIHHTEEGVCAHIENPDCVDGAGSTKP